MSNYRVSRGRFLTACSGTGAVASVFALALASTEFPLFFFTFWLVALIAGLVIGLASGAVGILVLNRAPSSRGPGKLVAVCLSVGITACSLGAGLWALLSLGRIIPTIYIAGSAALIAGAGTWFCLVLSSRNKNQTE